MRKNYLQLASFVWVLDLDRRHSCFASKRCNFTKIMPSCQNFHIYVLVKTFMIEQTKINTKIRKAIIEENTEFSEKDSQTGLCRFYKIFFYFKWKKNFYKLWIALSSFRMFFFNSLWFPPLLYSVSLKDLIFWWWLLFDSKLNLLWW